jgi:hypothetical protein
METERRNERMLDDAEREALLDKMKKVRMLVSGEIGKEFLAANPFIGMNYKSFIEGLPLKTSKDYFIAHKILHEIIGETLATSHDKAHFGAMMENAAAIDGLLEVAGREAPDDIGPGDPKAQVQMLLEQIVKDAGPAALKDILTFMDNMVTEEVKNKREKKSIQTHINRIDKNVGHLVLEIPPSAKPEEIKKAVEDAVKGIIKEKEKEQKDKGSKLDW